MPQPRPPYTYRPPAEIEVDAKTTISETIRAMRIIIGRSQPPETDMSDIPALPRGRSELYHRGKST